MPALQVVQILNNYLDQKNIRYCHWKSNEHVDAAVEGKTDLDVLVDENEKENLKQVLSEVGFKYFEAIPCRRYVDIDDYLAIDRETGILVHLHLHYRLELGKSILKVIVCLGKSCYYLLGFMTTKIKFILLNLTLKQLY